MSLSVKGPYKDSAGVYVTKASSQMKKQKTSHAEGAGETPVKEKQFSKEVGEQKEDPTTVNLAQSKPRPPVGLKLASRG